VAIILTLRDHETHAGSTLVHQTSEDVVLGNVFGIVKNLPYDAVLNPWLAEVTADTIPEADDWLLSFWERKPFPQGIREGSTNVDLDLNSTPGVVFAEVKMDAGPSAGTRHSEKRSQLVRSLDVGYAQAQREGKAFAVVYITPDAVEPPEVAEIRRTERSFPNNPGVDSDDVWCRFYWCNWASVGKTVCLALENGLLDRTEKKLALDLLAYLKKKGLWNDQVNTKLLAELAGDKLYRVLDPTGTYIPHRPRQQQRDQTWRTGSWTDAELHAFLADLSDEEKALLKAVAEAGGSMIQDEVLRKLPFLEGNTGKLRALKARISAGCRVSRKARILTDGIGSGPRKTHKVAPDLGALCAVVIEVARAFIIPAGMTAP